MCLSAKGQNIIIFNIAKVFNDIFVTFRDAVVTQTNSDGVEEEVGVLGVSDYFGEVSLLFDRQNKKNSKHFLMSRIFVSDQELQL